MSKLQEFLNELSDAELKQFYSYRFQEFLPTSKEKIIGEFLRRNIVVSKENNLKFEAGVKNVNSCPRCYSAKFYTALEIETISYSYASVEVKHDFKTCLVCLYSQEKEDNENEIPITGTFGFIRFLINRRK